MPLGVIGELMDSVTSALKKWVYGHKCTTTIRLHAMQEIWDLFQCDDVVSLDQPLPDKELAQLNLAISLEAMSGKEGSKSLKFQGFVQGHPVTILVDSGSTHTFLSSAIAAKLQGQQELSQPLRVQVANWEVLQCTQ